MVQAEILFERGQSGDVRPTAPCVYFRTVEIDINTSEKSLQVSLGRRHVLFSLILATLLA